VGITRQRGGYVLTVDPMAVDLFRFRHLVTEAQLTRDDPTAWTLYSQALGLWRGDAFAPLETPWLDAVRQSVMGERLAAELDRNDVGLRCGQDAGLLVELSERASAHPLDERLAGQLMLALYRCGRQAHALDLYDRTRRRLADELGTYPSPALQRRYHQILTGVPAGEQQEGLRPRQLPAPPRSFTGRARELAELDAAFAAAGGQQVCVVSGTAGVGKTALAVHWAHQVSERFPDGQLYLNLRGFDANGPRTEPSEAIRGFLEALGVPPQRIPVGREAQGALYRSVLADKRMIILLDNAFEAEQVRPLVPAAPGCLVLVTSRNRLVSLIAVDGAKPITVDRLPPGDARDLLARRLGPERLGTEPDAVDEIVARCAQLPLALTIVAARAATHPTFRLAVLADQLRDAGGLDAFDGGEVAADVRAVFSWSYRTLSAPAARLFRLLGLQACPDLSTTAAASLAGVSRAAVRPLLAELTRTSLVEEQTSGRFSLHDLLRVYAVELAYALDPDAERRAAIHRLLDHYLHTAHRAAHLLYPRRKPLDLAPAQPGVTPQDLAGRADAVSWCTTEHTASLVAVQLAATYGLDRHASQLARAVSAYLELRGHWHDWAATQSAGLAAARRQADRPAQADIHRSLASAHLWLGRHDDAHAYLAAALDLYGELADDNGRAHTYLDISVLYELRSQHPEALDRAQQALALFQSAGDREGQARALNTVGWCQSQLGDPQQALVSCAEALSLFGELGDSRSQAATWDSIGYAHTALGQHDQAVTCYQRALDLYGEVGDRLGASVVLNHLGDCHQAAGDPDQARTAWLRAVEILDQLGHPSAGRVRAKLA
jgi:tetratricopeptide (TPR) repeat protein